MPVLLAVGQMTATADVDENHATCRSLVEKAKARGAELLVLPENFAFMGEKDDESKAIAEPLDGPLLARYRALAKEHEIWLCLGGFPERGPADGRSFNTHVVVNADGEIAAAYRKLHLFDVDVAGGPRLLESKGTAPGDTLVTVDSPVGQLGLSICYDLRFPELYLSLAQAGAEVLLVPAAFTLTTGKEHWETLLRARAIETQCFVAAAAQRGVHNARRQSFGHAMIIDPWGTVVAQCADHTGIAVAEVDLEWMTRVRQQIPVWNHRRPEVYGRVGGPKDGSSA